MNRREFLNLTTSAIAYPTLAASLAEKIGLSTTGDSTEPDALGCIVDLSAFSNDDIIALLMQVQEEMVARGLHGKTANVPVGTYTAGVDLPVGKYTYESADYDINDAALAFEYGDLVVRDAQGSKIASYDVPNYGTVSYYITLGEGDTMTVPRRGILTVTSGGLLFE